MFLKSEKYSTMEKNEQVSMLHFSHTYFDWAKIDNKFNKHLATLMVNETQMQEIVAL